MINGFFGIYLVIFVVILFEYVITVVRSHGCGWVLLIVYSPPHLHGLRCNKGERSRVLTAIFTSPIAVTIYRSPVIVSGYLYLGMKSWWWWLHVVCTSLRSVFIPFSHSVTTLLKRANLSIGMFIWDYLWIVHDCGCNQLVLKWPLCIYRLFYYGWEAEAQGRNVFQTMSPLNHAISSFDFLQ